MISVRHNRLMPCDAVVRAQAVMAWLVSWLLALSIPLLVLVLVSSGAAAQQYDDLDATIEHLITYVKESNVKFERNFSSHDSAEAADHIEKKYQHFKDEIDTPEKFIELCATSSLMTGRQYLVITAQGEEIPAGEWLTTELQRYRRQTIR